MPIRPDTHKVKRATTPRHTVPEYERKKTAERGYGSKWRTARAAYLKAHPLCVQCEARGVITLATDLDHIIPHRGDMRLFWDFDNVQPLCSTCHKVKTGKGL